MASMSQELEQSLFIATSKTVHHRSQIGNRILFECDAAGGITNARASKDNSSLFAVANSHVVILCDALRGSKKSKLRKGNGEPRLLLFSPDSRTLYFTTTLSPSVQAYDMSTAEMLPSQQPHPSPPNVVSVSNDGNILLSASPTPPTIYIQDRRWGGSAPVNFQPTDAETPVSCAAFAHLSVPSSNLHTSFVLGFRDGKMAMYRLFLPTRRRQRKPSQLGRVQTFSLQPIRVGAIKKLHKASMGGVIAAEFVPGYTWRVLSIGHDGRCRLVDFQGGGKVLRTWHVAGPATCLSIVSDGPHMSQGRKDGAVIFGGDATEENGRVYEGMQTLIAIGTESGRVFIFNCLGLPVHKIVMEQPVVSLEWVGDMSAPSALPNRVSSMTPEAQPAVDTRVADNEAPSDEELATIRRNLPVSGQAIAALDISARPDVFSSNHTPAQISRRPWDVSHGSPVRIHRTGRKPQMKSKTRPRILTETFRSPILSSKRPSNLEPATPSSSQRPPRVLDTRNIQTAPSLPPPSHAHPLSSAAPAPAPASPTRDTESSTPPSTSVHMSRHLTRLSRPGAPAKHAAQHPASSLDNPARFLRDTCPASSSSPSSSSSSSTPPGHRLTSLAPSTHTLRPTTSPCLLTYPHPPPVTSDPRNLEPGITRTSTPPWLTSPSSPRAYFAAKRELRRAASGVAETPGSSSPASVYSRGGDLLDGQGGLSECVVFAGEGRGRVMAERCWVEVGSLRRDIGGLEREMVRLRGEVRELLARGSGRLRS